MSKVVPKKLKTKLTPASMHGWNVGLSVLHAIQGGVILLLSATRTFPVDTQYLTLDKISSELAGHPVLAGAVKHLFDVNLAYIIAGFFFVSALAHLLVATVYRTQYEAGLKKNINRVRWIEYGLSASMMIVAIGLLSGIADASTLGLLFVSTLVMNLLGWVMEAYNQGKARPKWLAYVVGCIAGVAPWAVVGFYLWSSTAFSDSKVPSFVYWIYLSMFVAFSSFAVNMYLQYKAIGKWKNYLYGERVYMILSLVAKTALAWQVFAGTLRP